MHANARDDDSPSSKLDNDLDALMDKYDNNEKKPAETKKVATKAKSSDSKVSNADIQDAELKIL